MERACSCPRASPSSVISFPLTGYIREKEVMYEEETWKNSSDIQEIICIKLLENILDYHYMNTVPDFRWKMAGNFFWNRILLLQKFWNDTQGI